ncbi:MAG TPA: hypothetical protein VF234_03180 [Limnochordia bacterium]
MRRLIAATSTLALAVALASSLAFAQVSVSVENPFAEVSAPGVTVGYEVVPDLDVYGGISRAFTTTTAGGTSSTLGEMTLRFGARKYLPFGGSVLPYAFGEFGTTSSQGITVPFLGEQKSRSEVRLGLGVEREVNWGLSLFAESFLQMINSSYEDTVTGDTTTVADQNITAQVGLRFRL